MLSLIFLICVIEIVEAVNNKAKKLTGYADHIHAVVLFDIQYDDMPQDPQSKSR